MLIDPLKSPRISSSHTQPARPMRWKRSMPRRLAWSRNPDRQAGTPRADLSASLRFAGTGKGDISQGRRPQNLCGLLAKLPAPGFPASRPSLPQDQARPGLTRFEGGLLFGRRRSDAAARSPETKCFAPDRALEPSAPPGRGSQTAGAQLVRFGGAFRALRPDYGVLRRDSSLIRWMWPRPMPLTSQPSSK